MNKFNRVVSVVFSYMRSHDIYVHAEIQGASSVVIRNNFAGREVPPKTLVEAGTMAISYSVAWDAKVATNAYWVYSHQVSKKAPTGEYLTTGSFMIRGKKNFLPACQLIMGISLLFKLEDSFVEAHRDERKARNICQESAEDEKKKTGLQQKTMDAIADAEEADSCTRELEQLNLKETENENNLEKDVPLQQEPEFVYPDTEIKIDHGTGRITLKSHESRSEMVQQNSISNICIGPSLKEYLNSLPEEETTIIPAMPIRQKQQQNSKKKKDEKKNAIKNKILLQAQQIRDESESVRTRAQKGKLKKMKEKYKDQTEEEQKLRIQILQKENAINVAPVVEENHKLFAEISKIVREVMAKSAEERKQRLDNAEDDEPAEDEDVVTYVGSDEELLNTLTGKPLEADELLFVIPVIAPYPSMQNYK